MEKNNNNQKTRNNELKWMIIAVKCVHTIGSFVLLTFSEATVGMVNGWNNDDSSSVFTSIVWTFSKNYFTPLLLLLLLFVLGTFFVAISAIYTLYALSHYVVQCVPDCLRATLLGVCVCVLFSIFWFSLSGHQPLCWMAWNDGGCAYIPIFETFFFSFSSVSFLSNGWWWWQWWWWDGRWLCCALTNYMLPSSILSLLSTTPQSRILRHSLTITLTRTPLSTHNDSSAVIKL